MSETKRDYKIGYGKPPRGRPFQKGQSGNPRGPRRKNLSALLIAALNEPAYVTIDGKRRKITNREAIVTQMVKHDDQVDSTAQMLDWFKQASSGPSSNAGIWHLYKQRYEARQAGASQTERPEPLSVMAKRLGLLRSL